jgi:hypothetical protein
MVFFLAGVAATFGLSTLAVFILIWRAPLIEDRSAARRSESAPPSSSHHGRSRSTIAAT